MAENKKSKSEKTREKIHSTFFSLAFASLGTTPNVSEICAEMDIYRSTFYNYYSGVDELIDSVSAKLLEEVTAQSIPLLALNELYGASRMDEKTIMLRMIKYLSGKRKQYTVLLCPESAFPFSIEIKKLLKKNFTAALSALPAERRDCAATFIADGLYAAVYSWLKSETLSLDDFVDLLCSLTYDTVRVLSQKTNG